VDQCYFFLRSLFYLFVGYLLHLITFNDTRARARTGPSQKRTPVNTSTLRTYRHLFPRRHSNPQS